MTKIDEKPPCTFLISRSQNIDHLEVLDQFLRQSPSVKFIRLQWQDYSGLLRARIVVVSHYRSLVSSKKALHAPPIGFHCIVDNNLVPWLDPTGAHLLLPDYRSLCILPNREKYAVLMCGVVETRPSMTKLDWDLCPRWALANVLSTAADQFDIDFLVGFEVEFEILHRRSGSSKERDTIVPLSTGLGRYAVDGLRDPSFLLVEDVIQVLLDNGVGVQTIQTEGRRGQYEISLGPRSPLEAVDELILVHDTLKESFSRQGYIVTMAPKPIASRRQAIGQHTHMSMRSATRSVAKEQSFLAGILARLPMLCAVCLPYELSYERVQPYLGGNQVAWGTENREVPIRQIRPGHWELRCVDATANMYLALATVLSAGLLGVKNMERLRWRDTALSLKEICHNGVDKIDGTVQKAILPPRELLPDNLSDALDALEYRDGLEDLTGMMRSRVLHNFLAVKRFEASKVKEMEPQTARDLLTELF